MRKLIAFSIAAMLLAACSNDCHFHEKPYSGEEKGFVMNAPQTRSNSDSTIVFRMFAAKYPYYSPAWSVEFGNLAFNKPYTVGDPLDWTLGNGELMAVHGYMPVLTSVEVLSRAGQDGFPEYLFTMDNGGKKCFCTTTLTGVRKGGSYDLVFSHRLCNLFFSLQNQLDKTVTLKKIRVYGLKSKGKYREGKGWHDVQSEDRVFSLDANMTLCPGETATPGNGLYMNVVPQVLGDDFRVEADWTSEKDSGTWTFTLEEGITLEEGTMVSLPLGGGVQTKSIGTPSRDIWTFTGNRDEVSYIQDGIPINITASINDWQNGMTITPVIE